MRLYDKLTPWYRLLDPLDDHEEEAAELGNALGSVVNGEALTLLELGAGAGNNAHYFQQRFRCTLVDPSEPMLALSRTINPRLEHFVGDMRTVRLERQFDAVLIHDAIVYLTSERDLREAFETAFVHTRPGGAALFAPDYVREAFVETSNVHEGTDGDRSLRCLEWAWDPDPADDTYRVDYAFLLRDQGDVRSVHDAHIEGLFPRATWIGLLSQVGYEVQGIQRVVPTGETDEIFLCRRPLTRP